ncbi:MAG: hypothetical protein P1U63_08975 [Coxiellaceae bacterium]|nr:hypothetical protein [Coxiellaceae bacterium]
MRKPVFLAVAACSSLFLRVPARIAFDEKLALLVGDTGKVGEIAGLVAGGAAVGGATAIVFQLMHSTMPDDSLDIDYKGALNPKRNKWMWLHFLMALPIMAAVVETESSIVLKMTGAIPRIAMDIIITKNLIHMTRNENVKFFSALRSSPLLVMKLVALLSIAVPLWLGLANGTAATAQAIFKFDSDVWVGVFKVLGGLGAFPFGSTIAHASVDGWLHPGEWSLAQAKGCRQASQQLAKNSFALIFTVAICAFYGVLAESGVSNFTNNNKVKNISFAYLTFVGLPFVQPPVNKLLSMAGRLVCRQQRAEPAPLTIVGATAPDAEASEVAEAASPGVV